VKEKASLALSLMLAVSLLVPLATYSAPRAKAQANSGSSSDPAFSTTIPEIKNSVSIQPTGTITRRSDDEPVWVWNLNVIDKDWLGGKSKPATVFKLRFTVKPNDLTKILYTDNVSAGVENFNQGYLYNGENITSTEFLDLQTEITEIPVHASIGQLENAVTRPITPPTGGGTDWISQGESNPVTLTILLRDAQSPELAKNVSNLRGSWASVRLGFHSLLVTITSTSDWDAGTHENTVSVGGDLQISKFEQMPDMPASVDSGHDLKYVEDGENVYATRGNVTATLWRYSTKGDAWYTMTDAPTSDIYSGGDFAYDGLDNLFFLQGNGYDNIFRYDISADSWSLFADVPPAEVWSGGSIEYDRTNDNIYVTIGGTSDNFYCYDLGTGAWTQLDNAPDTLGSGSDMELVGDNIYVARGTRNPDFYCYSISSGSWTVYPDVPEPEVSDGGDTAYLGDGENIYLQAGETSLDPKPGFYRFSITDNVWYTCENTPKGVSDGGSLEYVEAENSLYETPAGDTVPMYRYCLDNSAYSDAKHTTAKENFAVDKSWRKIEIDADIPSGASLDVKIQVSDNFAAGVADESDVISASDGIDNYAITGLENWKSEVRIVSLPSKGTSDFGPKVHSYKLFGENSPPQISTNFSENVDAYSVDLVGELLDNASTDDNIKFQYREEGTTAWENAGLKTTGAVDNHSYHLAGLKDNVTYEWRFWGQTQAGGYPENIGSIKTFTTDYPRVSFESKSEVSTSGFKVTCSIENRGEPSLDVILQYREKGAASWNEENLTGAAKTKDYSTTVDGLKSDTDYEVRWKIVGSTYYSDTWTITTKASGGGVPIAPTKPEPISIDVEVGRLEEGTFTKAKALGLGDVATVKIEVTSKGEPVEGADVGAWWIPKPTMGKTETIEISEVGGGTYQGSFTIPKDIAPGTYEVSAEATKSGYEKAYGYDTFEVVRKVAKPGPIDRAVSWARENLAAVAVLVVAFLIFVAISRR